jgi:putative NIF3 family GTP cyclohydrolase 1 type 2
MDLLSLTRRLDTALGLPAHPENLIKWAVTESNHKFIYQDFLDRKTGLMLKASTEVQRVYSSVFVSNTIIEKLSSTRDCLLFTHHNFNYYEDSRGLTAIDTEALQRLLKTGNSIYVAHAPLDTHRELGTSVTLSKLVDVPIDGLFYDYFGSPTGSYGTIDKIPPKRFAEAVQRKLMRPTITLVECRPFVEKVAVVAGGGDLSDLLQQAFDLGCDTLLTGTIENRWLNPKVQEANRNFHQLNEKLQLNLVGGTHFGTERPAMIAVTGLITSMGVDCEYMEDEELLSAL